MQFPERKAKLYTPEVLAKRGRGRSAFLRSGTPEANAQVERIRQLNPTNDPKVRAKLSAVLTGRPFPTEQGGNGRPLPQPQLELLRALGDGWISELAVSLGGRQPGYPTNYKLDVANPDLKIGIEADGFTHRTTKQKDKDRKKGEKLASLGWIVLRFWNHDILTWINSGMPTESSISTTLRSHGIRLSA